MEQFGGSRLAAAFLCFSVGLHASVAWSIDSGQVHDVPYSNPTHAERLPPTLEFFGDVVNVYQPSWFYSLFPVGKCDRILAPVTGTMQVRTKGDHELEIIWNGRVSQWIAEADSNYIPLHYASRELVHPYFDIRLPKWVRLRLIISRTAEGKELSLWLVKGAPNEAAELVPIVFVQGH